MEWLECWLTLCSLVGIAGHARCPLQMLARRTVAAVGARPGPSSFAPNFGASPQYCMLGAPSILRSLVESRDVQTLARPVDLVGETEFLQRQDPPGWPGRNGILLLRPRDLPSARPRGGVFLRTLSFWNRITFNFRLSEAPCPLLMGRLWLGACGGTSSGTPLSPSPVAPLHSSVPASRVIQNKTANFASAGLVKQHDNQKKRTW